MADQDPARMVRCFACKNLTPLEDVVLLEGLYPMCSRELPSAECTSTPDGRYEIVLVG
jgi:hypothetical protein